MGGYTYVLNFSPFRSAAVFFPNDERWWSKRFAPSKTLAAKKRWMIQLGITDIRDFKDSDFKSNQIKGLFSIK